MIGQQLQNFNAIRNDIADAKRALLARGLEQAEDFVDSLYDIDSPYIEYGAHWEVDDEAYSQE